MKYYLRDPEHQAITGPFELDAIEAKLKAGELPAGALATGDVGKGLAQILLAPPEDWVSVESIPGLGEERQPSANLSQPAPPPIPSHDVVSAPPSPASGMALCPGCGHKLAPDVGRVCDHCGQDLTVVARKPANTAESKPEAFVGMGGCLSLVAVIVGVIFLLGFLLLLTVMSKCKA